MSTFDADFYFGINIVSSVIGYLDSLKHATFFCKNLKKHSIYFYIKLFLVLLFWTFLSLLLWATKVHKNVQKMTKMLNGQTSKNGVRMVVFLISVLDWISNLVLITTAHKCKRLMVPAIAYK